MKLSLGITPRDYSVAGGAVVYDADAQAYFTANTAITSAADKNAINDFYLGLKTDGIYTKIKAMYLPIWGSAASCKWNLVNPLDTDAAFRLTFSTGWTFSSGGMTPLNAYANTYLIHNNVLSQNSWSAGIYSRTNRAGSAGASFGVVEGAGYSLLYTRTGANQFYAFVNALTDAGVAVTDSIGFMQIKRDSSTSVKLIKNSNVNSFSQLSTTKNTIPFYLGARNQNGTASSFDDEQQSFSYIADGLTDTDATNFYTRVNTLMTYFGINV